MCIGCQLQVVQIVPSHIPLTAFKLQVHFATLDFLNSTGDDGSELQI